MYTCCILPLSPRPSLSVCLSVCNLFQANIFNGLLTLRIFFVLLPFLVHARRRRRPPFFAPPKQRERENALYYSLMFLFPFHLISTLPAEKPDFFFFFKRRRRRLEVMKRLKSSAKNNTKIRRVREEKYSAREREWERSISGWIFCGRPISFFSSSFFPVITGEAWICIFSLTLISSSLAAALVVFFLFTNVLFPSQ